jgi:hypothetical protein
MSKSMEREKGEAEGPVWFGVSQSLCLCSVVILFLSCCRFLFPGNAFEV